ncbi:MAG: MaoC family dehydratase N-terminal domain-containing protein [Pseudomonadota bacterium]
MGQWDAWIGREQRASDRLDEGLAARWYATFDLVPCRPRPDAHAPMPQGIHFALCTPDAQTSALGEDGHPARDDSQNSFLPPFPQFVSGPRRMWASSDIEFHAPLRLGAEIKRVSRVTSITEKAGRSGMLAFVTVDHETVADGELAVREKQTLVYREAADPQAPLSPPELGDGTFDEGEWDYTLTLVPDERLLFRFSALTFNTHRIHYDAPYAREVERYRGLVVHGPLTASLLLQFASREISELRNDAKAFSFRGISPAIAGETLHLAGRLDGTEYELGAFADDGRQVMAARIAG